MYFSEAQEAAIQTVYFLCGASGSDFLRKVNDWDAFLRELMSQKIFVPAYAKIRSFLPEEIKSKYDSKHRRLVQKNKHYLSEASKIIAKANKIGLSPLIMKGIALSYYIYGNLNERQFGDMDFAIDADHMADMDKVLRGDGYRQYYIDLLTGYKCELCEPLLRSSWHHEYYGYEKDVNGTLLDAEIAKHLHMTVTGEHMREFIKHTEKIFIDGKSILTFDLCHTLLCTIENMYSNAQEFYKPGYMRLGDFLDLYLFLAKYGSTLNCDELNRLISKYHMQSAVSSVLNDLRNFFFQKDFSIIPEIMDNLGVSAICNEEIPVLHRIFNNDQVAAIHYYKRISSYIFSNVNTYYKTPLRRGLYGTPLNVICDDEVSFDISINLSSGKLSIILQSNSEISKFRTRLLLYNNIFTYQLNEITFLEDGGSLTYIVNNMNCTTPNQGEPNMHTHRIAPSEFNNKVGISNYAAWVTLDPKELGWTNETPDMLGLGILVEKGFGNGIYQRYYNIAIPPCTYILTV